jgi:hypothetical protein
MVFLQQVQPRTLAFEPAFGHVLGLRIVEGTILVRLDELGNELGAVDGRLPNVLVCEDVELRVLVEVSSVHDLTHELNSERRSCR